MAENLIPAEVEPRPNQAQRAAVAFQRLGFRILHIGTTISVQAPESLWTSTFNVVFEPQTKTSVAEVPGTEIAYQRARSEAIRVPTDLQELIADIMFQEPPEFFTHAS